MSRYNNVDQIFHDLDATSTRVVSLTENPDYHCTSLTTLDPAIWAKAKNAFDAGDFLMAMKWCERTLESSPGHLDAQEMLWRLQDRYALVEKGFSLIEQSIGAIPINGLIKMARRMTDAFPNHPAQIPALVRLESAHEKFEQLWELATEDMDTGAYHSALRCAEAAYVLNPDPLVTESADIVRELMAREKRITELKRSLR